MSGIFGVPGGEDLSPELSWSGAPAETKSYTVTMCDPDAPSGSGFWHWAVADIPASVTGLSTGAGEGTGQHLPTGAFHLPNDARLARFIGGGPPPGDGRHRYVIVVQALGIEKVGQLQLPVQADSTPAMLGFSIHQRPSPRPGSHYPLGGDSSRVTLRVETIPDLIVHERGLELDRRSQPTRCFGPEKPTRCNTMELSSFEQIKLTPAAGARRGALDALPILLTLC